MFCAMYNKRYCDEYHHVNIEADECEGAYWMSEVRSVTSIHDEWVGVAQWCMFHTNSYMQNQYCCFMWHQ